MTTLGGQNLGRAVLVLEADGRLLKRDIGRARADTQQQFAQLSKVVGASFLAIGAGITASLGLATKAAIDFESSFAGVRKTIDATEEGFQRLARGLRDMALEIPVNVNELNRIAEAAGQLGVEEGNILSFTRTMAQLGVTTNLTSEEAATSLARFSNIVGVGSDQVDRLGSVIVGLGNNFATTEREVVDMALRLGGAGRIVGLTAAEVLGLSAALSSVGIQAEAGGTAISQALFEMNTAVLSGTEELQTFADIAGVSAEEFAKRFRAAPTEALIEFVQGLRDIDDAGGDVAARLDDVGLDGARSARSIIGLAGNVQGLRDAFAQANVDFAENNALTEEAGKRFATTEAQLQLAKNQLSEVAITIGGTLLPHLVDLAQVVGNVVGVVGDWLEANEGLAKILVPAVAVVGLLTAALGALLLLLPSLASGLALFGIRLGATTVATTAYTGATASATVATVGFGTAIRVALGPLGLALSVIGLVAGAAIGLHFALRDTRVTIEDTAEELDDLHASLFRVRQSTGQTTEAIDRVLSGAFRDLKVDIRAVNDEFGVFEEKIQRVPSELSPFRGSFLVGEAQRGFAAEQRAEQRLQRELELQEDYASQAQEIIRLTRQITEARAEGTESTDAIAQSEELLIAKVESQIIVANKLGDQTQLNTFFTNTFGKSLEELGGDFKNIVAPAVDTIIDSFREYEGVAAEAGTETDKAARSQENLKSAIKETTGALEEQSRTIVQDPNTALDVLGEAIAKRTSLREQETAAETAYILALAESIKLSKDPSANPEVLEAAQQRLNSTFREWNDIQDKRAGAEQDVIDIRDGYTAATRDATAATREAAAIEDDLTAARQRAQQVLDDLSQHQQRKLEGQARINQLETEAARITDDLNTVQAELNGLLESSSGDMKKINSLTETAIQLDSDRETVMAELTTAIDEQTLAWRNYYEAQITGVQDRQAAFIRENNLTDRDRALGKVQFSRLTPAQREQLRRNLSQNLGLGGELLTDEDLKLQLALDAQTARLNEERLEAFRDLQEEVNEVLGEGSIAIDGIDDSLRILERALVQGEDVWGAQIDVIQRFIETLKELRELTEKTNSARQNPDLGAFLSGSFASQPDVKADLQKQYVEGDLITQMNLEGAFGPEIFRDDEGNPITSVPDAPGLQDGGRVTREGMALVGEAGPELLNLPRGAEVLPNSDLSKVFDLSSMANDAVRSISSGIGRGALAASSLLGSLATPNVQTSPNINVSPPQVTNEITVYVGDEEVAAVVDERLGTKARNSEQFLRS